MSVSRIVAFAFLSVFLPYTDGFNPGSDVRTELDSTAHAHRDR